MEINLKWSLPPPLYWWLFPTCVSICHTLVFPRCLPIFMSRYSQTCHGGVPKASDGFVLEPRMGCVWNLGPKTSSPGSDVHWGHSRTWPLRERVLLCESASWFQLAKAGTWLRFCREMGNIPTREVRERCVFGWWRDGMQKGLDWGTEVYWTQAIFLCLTFILAEY